ncbi:MAG: GMC family oxidoreductase [Alphaproteobacteria bacterium]|nr:MAG: GMC family oxidoreductase [Alphaproteobacteria bacterium]
MPAKDLPDLVIGSGPSGIAAAWARLEAGRAVTLVDAGAELEPERAAAREALAATGPEGWGRAAEDFRAAQYEAPPGQLRRYGSDFAMEPAGAVFADPPGWLGLRSSRALGGLTNLWGAAVLPWPAAEMAGWPVTAGDLAPHYRALAEFLPVAGRTDALEALLPGFPMEDARPLPATRQAEALIARLDAAAPKLAAAGITAGAARVAVAPGCRACGLCLHGCPWGLIFSAGQAIGRLRENPRFGYRKAMVRAIAEDAGGVTLHCEGGEEIRGARVFVGAGVLETARLMFTSLPGWAGAEVELADSPHGFLPLLQLYSTGDPGAGPHHTLALAFVELENPAISPRLVHTQLYGWNDFYAREMMMNYGRFLPLAGPLFRRVARRLIVAQSFLHSDHGPRIALSPAGDGENRLRARLIENPETAPVARRARAALARALRRAGLIALTPAARDGGPGSSFHVGASFPMAAEPGRAQTDPLGRPAGAARIHLVDASVMPAIPAATVTLAVMANAHRIAAMAGD